MKQKLSVLLASLFVGAGIWGVNIPSIPASGHPVIQTALTEVAESQKKQITIRTENYPRPPYSGATYYIYERDGEVICTKLEVCNKFNDCEKTYKRGLFKEDFDVDTGEPNGKTAPVVISRTKQKKHVCLTKFKLL